MGVSDPLKIFNSLDIDGGGSLDIGEFCDGLYTASVSKTPIEFRRIDKMMERMQRQNAEMQRTLNRDLSAVIESLANATVGPPGNLKGTAHSFNGFIELEVLKAASLQVSPQNRLVNNCHPVIQACIYPPMFVSVCTA